MSVIRVGSTSRYADGWEQIFGGASGDGRRGRPAAKKAKARAKPAVERPARKKPVKGKAGRTRAKSRAR